jgi:sirohydrochlorin ferrochelatase
MPTVLLVDNGSRRADATLNLRRLAEQISLRSGIQVHPVSLQHSNRIKTEELGGMPALTFEPFMRQRLEQGERAFIMIPLFFGPSKALTRFIPDHMEQFGNAFGEIDLKVAEVLCPLPTGEPRLTRILEENIASSLSSSNPNHIILVDHGSPIPEVTAVRNHLARELGNRMNPEITMHSAVMERRSGKEYDFNGALLEDLLEQIGKEQTEQTILLAMLFMSPGRHAGPGGDIEEISASAQARFKGLRIIQSPLIGGHPLLIDILEDRLKNAMGYE